MTDDTQEAPALESLVGADHEELLQIINQEMPFGRFKGRRLIELPEPYLVWFKGQGFPRGKLGERMAVMYEIKANGIERLLRPLVGMTREQLANQSISPESNNAPQPNDD